MRILLVNKFWYPKGGSERYTFALRDLLEVKGHEVIPFAMEDERNLPTPWADHFVSHVDFWDADDAVPNQTGGIEKLARVLWSGEAARKMEELIVEANPDVAHLQNFAHQISPSILPVLARHHIPTVWTLHDYKALCPNYRMYTRGAPCERCTGHRYANAVRYRCMGSWGASAAVAVEMYLHHAILNVYGKHLAAVIAPSEFLAERLRAWGWNGRVDVVPNFIMEIDRSRVLPPVTPTVLDGDLRTMGGPRPASPTRDRSPVLFVGRLVEEKGIADFRAAARQLPDIPFEVIGDGPLASEIRDSNPEIPNLTWRGALPPSKTAQRIAAARILVVPSRWYENAPYVVLEAMAAGVPVIASRIGGLPELVRHGETGLLVSPRDPAALAAAIRILYADAATGVAMGDRARAIAAAEYGADRHAAAVLAIYERISHHA